MIRGGRPLRFFVLVMGGWIGVRTAILWPQAGSLPAALRQALPLPVAAHADTGQPAVETVPSPVTVSTWHAAVADRTPAAPLVPFQPTTFALPRAAVTVSPERVQLALLALAGTGGMIRADDPVPLATTVSPVPLPQGPGIDLSVWLLARPGSAAGGPVQLGGGQAGARLRVPIAGTVAAVTRVATPLAGRGREVAGGVEWRPTRMPIAVIAERRVALDRGADGVGLGVVGGTFGSAPYGFDLETYAQAGAVARDGIEPYVDGAVRMVRPVARPGGAALRLGAGIWGGGQREAARLDIGPSATLDLPVGQKKLRIALDWRQRVAGDAAPGSGPAVTLGSDF